MDIIEFEILEHLLDSDSAVVIGQMVKIGVRDLLLRISDEEVGMILRKIAKHLDTYLLLGVE